SLTQHRGQFCFPFPYGFVGKDYPAIQEHLGEVTQTQFVAYAPQHHQTENSGRVLQAIADRACPFIEVASTASTAKPAVTLCGNARTFRGGRRITVRAVHLPPPPQHCILLSTT